MKLILCDFLLNQKTEKIVFWNHELMVCESKSAIDCCMEIEINLN